MKVSKEILSISNPSFKNIPPTAVEDTARRSSSALRRRTPTTRKPTRTVISRTPTKKKPTKRPSPKKTVIPKKKPTRIPLPTRVPGFVGQKVVARTTPTPTRTTRTTRTTRFTPKPKPKPTPKPTRQPTRPTRISTTKPGVKKPPRRIVQPPPPPPKPKTPAEIFAEQRRGTPPTPKPTPKKAPQKRPPPRKAPTRVPVEGVRGPPGKRPVAVQQPTTVIDTLVQETSPGTVETIDQTITQTPTAVQEVKRESPRDRALRIRAEKEKERVEQVQVQKQAQAEAQGIPLVPGVPGLIGGVPLVAGQVPFQETTEVTEGEKAFKLEGFKGQGEGFLGGAGAARARAEALDLSQKVLSEEVIDIPGEDVVTTIPGGPPVETTETFIDPETGLLTTRTKITTPGDTIITTPGGGQEIRQTIGQSEVKPDFSDPVGSLVGGASQSFLNEVIGIKNLPAASKQLITGEEQPQEEFFATPSSILFGGAIDAVTKLGGEIFDFGRTVAGKPRAEAGDVIETFGIAGDKVSFVQQERGKDSFTILEESGQRATRLAVADPLFAVGDAAVQIPLLIVAPIKAATTGARVVGKTAQAVKGLTKAGKAQKLKSATGQPVTQIQPKTPFRQTFAEEFKAAEITEKAQAPTKAKIQRFESLTPEERQKVLKQQRDEFEKAVEEAQQRPKVKRDLGPAEETAEFAQRRRDADEFARLPTERISPTQIDPDLQKLIKEIETPRTPAEQFAATRIGLGTGIGRRLGDDIGDIGDIGRGGRGPPPPKPPEPPPTGFTGTGVDLGAAIGRATQDPTVGITGFTRTAEDLGTGTVTKVKRLSKKQVDDIAKELDVPKKQADDIAKRIADDAAKTGDDTDLRVISNKRTLQLVKKNLDQETKALKELEEAKEVLKKTKSTQKTVSSIADQKTQRRLSQLIKNEKIKKAELPSNKATVIALRKLVAAEKAKQATKAIAKTTKPKPPITTPKPKAKAKPSVIEEPPQFIRTPKGKGPVRPAVLGGIATGVAVGAGVGIGLNQQELNKPTVITNEKIFDKEISKVVNDPTIQITETSQRIDQPVIQIQPPRFDQPPTEREILTPVITPIITQKPPTTTITPPTLKPPTTTLLPPTTTEIITTVPPVPPRPPGFPPGFPFDIPGAGSDKAKKTKAQRRFFRLFDVAKTPFGRIEVGLGAQVQSDKPIFEFEDVPTRSGRKRRNLGEDFFSDDFADLFA